jgi:trimeric autotransporter adhesin
VYTEVAENGTGRKLGIQSLPPSDYENIVIPVGVIAEANKEIIFSTETSNLPTGINVYLEDRIENTFTKLDDANSEYKIKTTEKLDGVGRFYLHTKSSSALSIDSIDLNSIRIYKTNANNLRISGLAQGSSSFKLFNLLGREVLSTSFSTNGNKDITLPNLASGVYIVQLETESGKLNKKITLN